MDELLRTTLSAARDEVEATIDVDRAWHDLAGRLAAADDPVSVVGLERRPRHRGWIVLAAAAAMVAVVAGVAVVLTRPDEIRTVDTTPTVTSVVPAPTTVPITVPITAPPSTVVVPDGLPTISVSYRALPPIADVDLMATISIASPDQAERPAAIGERGVAMVGRRSVTVAGWDGTTREVPIDVTSLSSPLYGPGDVLYGLDPATFEFVAVALSGPRAGQIVSGRPIPPEEQPLWGDAVTRPLVHGDDGVVAVDRQPGAPVIGYVDVAGNPIDGPDGPLPEVGLVTSDASRYTLRSGDRFVETTIERGPDWVEPVAGRPSPARGPGGAVVYATTLGLSEFADGSIEDASVIMTLGPTGEAFWSTIDPAFEFVASSPWGVLVRRDEPATGSVTLATLRLRPIIDPATLDAEPTGIAVPCTDGFRCFAVGVAPDGALASYDRDAGTLTVHRDPPVTAEVDGDGLFLAAVGPDDTVYLVTSPVNGTSEEGNDVVAVSMAADRAGTIVRRWEHAIGMSGDSELVATPEGIVIVDCCGMDTVRPEPGAPVEFPWLDRTGAEVTLDAPAVRFDTVGKIVTVGDAWWGLVIREAEGDRGMPPIEATIDGGFVGVFPDVSGSSNVTVVRGWPDGTHTQVVVSGHPEFLTPDGRLGYPRDGEYVIVDPFAR